MFGRDTYADWCLFYESVGVDWQFRDNVTHLNLPGERFPTPRQVVLNVQQVRPNQTNEIFRKLLVPYAILASAPGSFNGVPYELEDLVSNSVRDASTEDYTIVTKKHVVEENGTLTRVGRLDHRLTVEEAMLYHSFNIWKYGDAYMKLQYADFHPCSGTPGVKGLRFDLHDYKVCLD